MIDGDALLLIRNPFAGNGAFLVADAVPNGDGLAVFVLHGFAAVVVDEGVAVIDVFEVAQDGFGQFEPAVDAVVPLQVADPEHDLGDGGGAGVEFDAEELVGVYGEATGFHAHLSAAEVAQGVEHFAFEAFHVFEGDVEEVAAAAGGVEYAGVAELVVEVLQLVDGLVLLALLQPGFGGDLDGAPLVAQRVDKGGHDQAFDVGAWGVVGTEFVAFAGVEGAFQQGAEDGGLDLAPVVFGGVDE